MVILFSTIFSFRPSSLIVNSFYRFGGTIYFLVKVKAGRYLRLYLWPSTYRDPHDHRLETLFKKRIVFVHVGFIQPNNVRAAVDFHVVAAHELVAPGGDGAVAPLDLQGQLDAASGNRVVQPIATLRGAGFAEKGDFLFREF